MPLDHQAIILTEALSALDDWGGGLLSRKADDSWWKDFDDQPFPFEMRHLGIPYEPKEWLDRPLTESERQGFSRGVKQLALLGLVVPVARYGSRLSHVRLTPRGLAVAIRVVRAKGTEPDLRNIAKALKTSEWATAKHLAATKAAARQEAPSDG
jgi:hypothetical protein